MSPPRQKKAGIRAFFFRARRFRFFSRFFSSRSRTFYSASRSRAQKRKKSAGAQLCLFANQTDLLPTRKYHSTCPYGPTKAFLGSAATSSTLLPSSVPLLRFLHLTLSLPPSRISLSSAAQYPHIFSSASCKIVPLSIPPIPHSVLSSSPTTVNYPYFGHPP
jgi:hypothetical protein